MMNTLRLSLAFAVAVLAGACSSDTTTVVDMASSDQARSFDLANPSGIGTACKAGRTQAGTCGGDDQVCLTDGTLGFSAGYCTADCSSTACPSDSDCVEIAAGTDLCLVRCNSDADCRGTDYVCSPYKTCLPAKGIYLGSAIAPGTAADGSACVKPEVTPPMNGKFEANQQLSSFNSIEAVIAADDAAGTVVAAWVDDFTHSVEWASSQDKGGTFSAPTSLPQDNKVDVNASRTNPSVATDGKGNYYIAYYGTGTAVDGIYVATSNDGGATFPFLTRVTDADEGDNGPLGHPWIATGPDGSAYVTWTAVSTSGSPIIRIASSPGNGASFGGAATVTTGHGSHDLSEVAVGSDGTVYVVDFSLVGNAFGDAANKIELQRLAPDLTPSGALVTLSGSTDSPVQDTPSIAVHGNAVHVVFTSGTADGAWDIHAVSAPIGTAAFGASVKVNDDATCATHMHPAAAVGTEGRLHVVYYDARYGSASGLDGNVLHQVATTAGASGLTFTAPDFVNDTVFPFTTEVGGPDELGAYMGLVASNGHVFVSWDDSRTNSTSQVFFTRSGFTTP